VTKLQAESSTDQKTGLLNFTSWRETTVHSLVRTARLRQPVALMLIDLDHFKRINDTHGHLMGDQVLAAVANCLRTDLREYDAVGRFGGEEFVVFLDNADLYAAVAAANRLRASISAVVIDGTDRVTASIGIAHSSKSSASLEALLERADAALYEAKAGGRDQVRAVSASTEIAQPAA
jgi:diguanylate cyclase (GGDEF)-like protein